MSSNLPNNPRNILLVRLSAIGDIVMASGLPTQLHERWPDAKITWLCQPECVDLLAQNPDVAEVLVWPRKEWQSAWKSGNIPKLLRLISSFRKDCRNRQFDLAIDLQGLLKSALFTNWSGANYRLGLGRAEGAAFLYSQRFERNLGDTQVIGSEYRYLADQLGSDSSRYRMCINTDQAATQNAAQCLQKLSIGNDYLVFCPFTTRPQKHWFDEHWRELAVLLSKQLELPILVLGGPADRELAEALCNNTPMINLAGETGLTEAYELIRNSKGVIGVDTGLTHMGHAARVPTLALFGSTCPYVNPDNPNGKVLYLNLDCAPCRRNPTCGGSFDCLRKITPQMVIQEFFQLYTANS